MELKPIQSGAIVRIIKCKAGTQYNNVNAEVLEVLAQGTIMVRPLMTNSWSGVNNGVNLTKDDIYEIVALQDYEVTVSRSGHIRIQAANEQQALELVKRFILADKICWSDFFESADAHPIQ